MSPSQNAIRVGRAAFDLSVFTYFRTAMALKFWHRANNNDPRGPSSAFIRPRRWRVSDIKSASHVLSVEKTRNMPPLVAAVLAPTAKQTQNGGSIFFPPNLSKRILDNRVV